MSKSLMFGQNQFGLKNGDIPKGHVCPFREKCFFMTDDCPAPTKTKETKHTCAIARSWALISTGSDNLTLRSIITREQIPKETNDIS